VTVTPDPPLLGRPLAIDFTLDNPDATLAGLPALGSFELLVPPRCSNGTLHLLLLPMRPGLQTFPALPLQHGGSGSSATAPLPLQIVEGLAEGATLAPLLTTTKPPDRAFRPLWWLMLPALAMMFGVFWRRHRQRRRQPSTPPTIDTRLATLQHRLEPLLATHAAARSLNERLQLLRFGPAAATVADLAELESALATLGGDAP
jgi:hypothetical protein